MISADAITSRTFTTVRFKEGYSTREVDDFLDEIVDRMATGDHSLARRIKEKTFSNVRFRGGYDIRARATRATRILRPLRPTATRRSCHGDGCAGVSLKDRGQPTSTAAPRSYLLVVVFAERFVPNFQ